MKISRVPTARCLVGEGPVWDVAEQALYFLDIVGQKIHRFDPVIEATRTWATPMPVGAMAMRESGGAVAALRDEVHALDWESGQFTQLARAENPSGRCTINDGATDRSGRFLVGLCDSDMRDPKPVGGLASLDCDHTLTTLEDDIFFSNGPCFSPDGRILYFSDSNRYATFAYDYDLETGRANNKRQLIDTSELGGMPDGATVDADGLIWMAIFRAGKVAAFRPDGKIERVVTMPASLPVSVMFGGPALDLLYVTSIDPAAFGEPSEDGEGHVYVIEGLGARGLPETRYAG